MKMQIPLLLFLSVWFYIEESLIWKSHHNRSIYKSFFDLIIYLKTIKDDEEDACEGDHDK
jgi:hypothetical protein